MKRLLHRNDLKTTGAILVVRIAAGKLDRRFVRFCAAVAKKDFVGKRMVHQHLRQLYLWLGVVQIRGMNQLRRLFLDRQDQIRVSMPENIDGNSADKIDVFPPFQIVDLRAAPSHDRDRLARIGVHQDTVRRLSLSSSVGMADVSHCKVREASTGVVMKAT